MLQNIILAAVVVAIIAAIVYLNKTISKLQELKDAQQNDKSVIMLDQRLQSMSERFDVTNNRIADRLDKAAQVIMGVQKELGTVQERFKGFEEFNELLHPKMRGNIGEQILADMLSQVFPPEIYELQFKFKDGSTVDAIIRTAAGIVPIDSKFPLENFKQLTRATTEADKTAANKEFTKAVKKHIDDISKKYILPEEGTVGFAMMYVPSENVYYHILTDEENALLDYAKSKNVLVTSPHGFFNFLRVILMGLERARLQEQAQKIWDILKGVQQESVRFNDDLAVLARHLTNAKGAMDNVQSHYAKLTGKLDQVKLLE
ncbi:MAG: DNA recombination protein RmuC [Patescibacteria group bacterium]|nr:DNA recombination protein RmuC [Patescibacteria group bacterium]